MNDCVIQEVRKVGSEASQSMGAGLTDTLVSVLRRALIVLPGSLKALLARWADRNLALVPVPAPIPHPVRLRAAGGTRSFGG